MSANTNLNTDNHLDKENNSEQGNLSQLPTIQLNESTNITPESDITDKLTIKENGSGYNVIPDQKDQDLIEIFSKFSKTVNATDLSSSTDDSLSDKSTDSENSSEHRFKEKPKSNLKAIMFLQKKRRVSFCRQSTMSVTEEVEKEYYKEQLIILRKAKVNSHKCKCNGNSLTKTDDDIVVEDENMLKLNSPSAGNSLRDLKAHSIAPCSYINLNNKKAAYLSNNNNTTNTLGAVHTHVMQTDTLSNSIAKSIKSSNCMLS